MEVEISACVINRHVIDPVWILWIGRTLGIFLRLPNAQVSMGPAADLDLCHSTNFFQLFLIVRIIIEWMLPVATGPGSLQ